VNVNSTGRRRARLGEFLLAKGVISDEQVEQALAWQKEHGVFLGEALVALGHVSPTTLGKYMEELTTYPHVELSNYPLNLPLAHQLPEQYARHNLVLPFAEWDGTIHVAMVNPQNLSLVDDLRDRLKRRIIPFFSFKSDLIEVIDRVYDGQHMGNLALAELKTEPDPVEALSAHELEALAEQAPIVRLVNGIIESAVASKASDIHIEPQERNVRVRFRQDGMLCEQMTFARTHLPAVISRIKIMAQLNIAERRKPQDGRISVRDHHGGEYDLRVNLLPVVHGESVVMRVLDKRMTSGTLEDLGMEPELIAEFRSIIHQPHGLLLVTGPTGSGKTTTLYSSLMEISTSDKKIMTVEDPVEYQLAGINQAQVNPNIGLDFADCLRAIVRQDPDVILVGEIRDRETAEVAIQAALTGHLVLSTLHTNDAPGALIRLQNMGIEPFLLASSVIGIMAQRLLRTVCPFCRESSPASDSVIAKFGLAGADGRTPHLYKGTGCPRCSQKGMKGRTAVYEFMPMSEQIKELMMKSVPSSHLRAQAVAEGMVTMRSAAIRKVLDGVTSLEEAARVLNMEDTSEGKAPVLRMAA
jgi:type IV pilus assembly protein PilB